MRITGGRHGASNRRTSGNARLSSRSATPHDDHASMTTHAGASPSTRTPPTRDPNVIGEWWCPVCDAPAHRTRQSGRPRVYCTNACRQRAYRWRRDHHARLAATPDEPAERANVGIRGHALRSRRDFVSSCSDPRHREVSVCGAFARPVRLNRVPHTNFVADNRAYSCRSCIRLIAIPNETIDSSWPPAPPLGRWSRELNRMI
jgi:hypothetical protein